MPKRNAFVPGKIILSGEYAAVFGYASIAVPSSLGIRAVFDEDSGAAHIEIRWADSEVNEKWLQYAEKITGLCQKKRENPCGQLVIHSNLPLGKGMGSSTALLVAIARILLGPDAREEARFIEDTLNPGGSGLDFETIWKGAPIVFRKGVAPILITLPPETLREAILIDTGPPSESTTELVAWMQSRGTEIEEHLKTIGNCTERLIRGEPLDLVMRDHHRAQVALGVVPPQVQELIAAIERLGGVAKVIGAGARRGRAGVVLALGKKEKIQKIADEKHMATMHL